LLSVIVTGVEKPKRAGVGCKSYLTHLKKLSAKMPKYYFTCGKHNIVLTAKNQSLAATQGFRIIVLNSEEKEIEFEENINISEIGFGEHDGDFVISIATVLEILYRTGENGEPREEERPSDDKK